MQVQVRLFFHNHEQLGVTLHIHIRPYHILSDLGIPLNIVANFEPAKSRKSLNGF